MGHSSSCLGTKTGTHGSSPLSVIAAGVWLLILTAILYGYDRGGWWRILLIAAAAGHFYFAYLLHRLPRAAGASPSADSTVGEVTVARITSGIRRQSRRAASERSHRCCWVAPTACNQS